MTRPDSVPPGVLGGREFSLTHWSVVLAAANGANPDATAAWEKYCQAYWYPLDAFLRRTIPPGGTSRTD